MKILENRTPEQASDYFIKYVANLPYEFNHEISEVYAEAIKWKRKNVSREQWNDYPIREVCLSLIYGELD